MDQTNNSGAQSAEIHIFLERGKVPVGAFEKISGDCLSNSDVPCRNTLPEAFLLDGEVVTEFNRFIDWFGSIGYSGRYRTRMMLPIGKNGSGVSFKAFLLDDTDTAFDSAVEKIMRSNACFSH